MQSAIGRVALKKVHDWVRTRRAHAEMLTDAFQDIPGLRVTVPPKFVEHAYYKYYVFIDPSALRRGWSRDLVMQAIAAEGVPCFSGSCSEIYLEKAFSLSLRPARRLPVAKELGETSLMFLVHPTLTPEHIERTIQVVQRVMKEASAAV
jgi:hypothetical protein